MSALVLLAVVDRVSWRGKYRKNADGIAVGFGPMLLSRRHIKVSY